MKKKKLRAAGVDDSPNWVALTVEQILLGSCGYELDQARSEFSSYERAGIFEKGPVWTECWHALGLSRLIKDPSKISVPEKSWPKLVTFAETHDEAFRLFHEIVDGYSKSGTRLPVPAQEAIMYFSKLGSRPPKKKGRPPNVGVWARNHMIHHVGRMLSNQHGMHLTRNQATLPDDFGDQVEPTVAASDIVYHVLNTQTNILDFGTIQNILTNEKIGEKYQSIRFMWIDSLFD